MESVYNIRYFDKERNSEMVIPLEKMVGILLNSEIDLNFHIEALKAQSIVIRTNLLKSSKSIQGEGLVDIWDHEGEDVKKIIEAVEKTKDMVMIFNGKLIEARYHLACGGSTENSEDVINNQVIYLRRVLCEYCKDSPYWQNERYFSIEEIEKLLKVKFPMVNVNFESEMTGFIEEVKKDENNRIKSIKIGNKKFSGVELMELLNLNSTRFAIFPTGIKLVSRGKGHGIGLCQYGANKMAEEGHTFEDILKYYYTGIDIKKMTLPCIKKPLYGKIIVIDPGHGGEDKGYRGDLLGLLEKDIALSLSLQLKSKLDSLGATVHLIRNNDTKILATDRLEQANKFKPDFFISIHMDYFPNSSMKGVEMFHFRNDIESQSLGLHILKSLKKRHIFTRGVKEGNFYVFRGISSSSLLIELGFLSNKDEEIKFQDDNYIKKLVDGIAEGILEYFKL